MKLNLIVMVAGPSRGKLVTINRFPFLIGRDQQCNLRPSNGLVSNRHCKIENRTGKAFVVDLGSTNGTIVNDQPVITEKELENGDRLQIGPLVFEIQLEKTPSVNQRTPLPPSKVVENSADDESIAAVLLSMQEDGAPGETTTVDSEGVPTGGTAVMDSNKGTVETAALSQSKPGERKPAVNPDENTSAVAEQLLNKYLRRPRKK